MLIGKVAVAIDGDIIHDPFLDPVAPTRRCISCTASRAASETGAVRYRC